ncbi:MAG: bile acid:sodium symporter [Sulfurovum sp.]|nr:MAG: bile acid:sodium symporter [Sulfurovum sp.]
MQAGILITVILPVAVFIIMFGLGLSLRIADFTYVLKEPKAIFVGISAQIIALPLIAFFISIIFQLPPELAMGLMIISFVPGGSTSNMFTNLAKGDVALSISLTAIASLVTPFTVPLFSLWTMRYFLGTEGVVEIPLLKTIIQLFIIMILPVITGIFILSKWQKTADKLEPLIRLFSVVFLFLIAVAIIVKNKVEMIGFFMQTGVAVLTLNILVLGLGYWLAKFFQLSQKQAISIGYEVGIQNGALALIIAGTIIGNSTMMIPAVTYSLLMFISGFAFYWILKKKAIRSETHPSDF